MKFNFYYKSAFKCVFSLHSYVQIFFILIDQLVQKGLTIATSSSTYKHFDASRAVDKHISQDISHCSHTDDLCHIKEAWLRIDLREVYSIDSVKFWYRTDGKVCIYFLKVHF